MSFITSEESGAEVFLLLKIGELRDLARKVLDDVDDIRAGTISDVKTGIDMFEEVRRFEMKLIRLALHATHGQQRHASRLLGLKATTLNAKIKGRATMIVCAVASLPVLYCRRGSVTIRRSHNKMNQYRKLPRVALNSIKWAPV